MNTYTDFGFQKRTWCLCGRGTRFTNVLCIVTWYSKYTEFYFLKRIWCGRGIRFTNVLWMVTWYSKYTEFCLFEFVSSISSQVSFASIVGLFYHGTEFWEFVSGILVQFHERAGWHHPQGAWQGLYKFFPFFFLLAPSARGVVTCVHSQK